MKQSKMSSLHFFEQVKIFRKLEVPKFILTDYTRILAR
jgi:hypothetical protein